MIVSEPKGLYGPDVEFELKRREADARMDAVTVTSGDMKQVQSGASVTRRVKQVLQRSVRSLKEREHAKEQFRNGPVTGWKERE